MFLECDDLAINNVSVNIRAVYLAREFSSAVVFSDI